MKPRIFPTQKQIDAQHAFYRGALVKKNRPEDNRDLGASNRAVDVIYGESGLAIGESPKICTGEVIT